MIGNIAKFIIGAIEKLTGYMGVISSDHAYIHKGKAYTAIIQAGSISAAYDICFKTPNPNDSGTEKGREYIHWRPIGLTTSADYVAWQLTEGESYTGGSAVTPRNRNRNYDDDSQMQAFVSNATCTPAGTLIAAGGVGTSGVVTAKSGGGASADDELLLKPDTVYCMTLTPDGATTVTAELFWYEEGGYEA